MVAQPLYILRKVKFWLRLAAVPISFAFLYIILAAIFRNFNLDSPTEILEYGQAVYSRYGVAILLPAAFIEGIFLVNLHFPGMYVFLFAVLVSDKSITSLLIILVSCWSGFMLAGLLNYWMGKHGYYRALLFLGEKTVIEKIQLIVQRYKAPTLFLASVLPSLLAISLVCVGIAKENILRTMVIVGVSLLFWLAIWLWLATTALNLVDVYTIQYSNSSIFAFAVLILWGTFLIIKGELRSKQS